MSEYLVEDPDANYEKFESAPFGPTFESVNMN